MPTAAEAAELTVKLAPAGKAWVAQGEPFRFKASFTSADAMTAYARFDLIPPSGQPVGFQRVLVVVPPGAPTEVESAVTPSQWYAGVGRYRIVASLGGVPVGEPLIFEVRKPNVTVPRFANVTQKLGLSTAVPDMVCGRWVNGAAWADVNGDGRLDLFVTRASAPEQLFVNTGSGFRDEAVARGVDGGASEALAAVFADVDNDGDQDLFVGGFGPDLLYRNDGKGFFADITPQAGVSDPWGTVSASFGDYDADGKLDLYAVNHSDCRGDVSLHRLEYHPDRLYHGNGDGTFTDATELVEKDPGRTDDGATTGAGFGAAWTDYNGDNRQDLLLANDFLGLTPDRNHLWRNDGPGAAGWQLTDVSAESGMSIAINSMGIAIGDYDRDVDFDYAMSNWGPNVLMRNNGNGTFTDVARALGADRELQRENRLTIGWGLEFGDLNLDSWEDLYLATGFLIGYMTEPDTPQTNAVLVNRAGRFLDLSAPSGADDPGQSRGVASADYDRDGRLDLYVVNQGGPPNLFRNVTPKGAFHWLEVRAVGTRSARDACGTELVAEVPGAKLLRQVSCGSTSVSSGSDKVVHFGLATHKKVPRLTITWPTGVRQVLQNVKADRLLTITEPKV